MTARITRPHKPKGPAPKPIEERFWPKVNKGDGCWEWMGSKNARGYGLIWKGQQQRAAIAHRVSWEMSNGPIPQGLQICHACDNPSCVNPSHLFLGTHMDNQNDCTMKGRRCKGENNGRAKLREEEVGLIKKLLNEGIPATTIARNFGIAATTVDKIKWGWIWKHVRL